MTILYPSWNNARMKYKYRSYLLETEHSGTIIIIALNNLLVRHVSRCVHLIFWFVYLITYQMVNITTTENKHRKDGYIPFASVLSVWFFSMLSYMKLTVTEYTFRRRLSVSNFIRFGEKHRKMETKFQIGSYLM